MSLPAAICQGAVLPTPGSSIHRVAPRPEGRKRQCRRGGGSQHIRDQPGGDSAEVVPTDG